MKRASRKNTSRKRAKPVKEVPPPPGWETIEEFEPAPPEEPADVMADMRADLVRQLRAGYLGDAAIVKALVEAWKDQIPAKEIRAEARRVLPQARAEHMARQRGWPKVTDCDRLDKAFAELERSGILTRQDYWCCGTCGCAAIYDEMQELVRKKKRARGYTFFHAQDTQAVVEGESLFLNYGAVDCTAAGGVAIGKEVVRVLRKHGLKPKWSGKIEQRIRVTMKWQRRRA